MTVERYRWSDGRGELALRLETGLFRIAGGALNRQQPIKLAGGSCTVTVTDASAIISVAPDGAMQSYMLVGGKVELASGGGSEALVRLDVPDDVSM